MTNLELIEKLANTAVFESTSINNLLMAFFEDNNLFKDDIDHLVVREKISKNTIFPDAQAQSSN